MLMSSFVFAFVQIIVIIISWWNDKRKLEKENAVAGGTKEGESKDKPKEKDVEAAGELNPELLTSLLLEEEEKRESKCWNKVCIKLNTFWRFGASFLHANYFRVK